jgi:septal ring factor EnvC (AmiA/AmiB activator)
MRFIAITLFLFLSVAAVAQKQVQYSMTKEELVAKQKQLMSEINETQQQLDAIKNDKKATMGQLRALQNKLAQRQSLISTINDEMDDIDHDIKKSSTEVLTLKQKLELLKTRYAQSIRYAYETRSSYDMLAFLFSSNDFNDAMRRMKYLKTFREFRKQQVEQIRTTQAQLEHKIGTLNAAKAQKEELANTQEQQKKVLVQETSQANEAIQQLKGKESELLKQIEKNKKIAARVNNAISQVIEREMAKAAKQAEEEARKRALAEGKSNPNGKPVSGVPVGNTSDESGIKKYHPKTKTPSVNAEPTLLTPAEAALSNSFAENQGRLYWPVEKGYITDHFGDHPNPLAPQVIMNNHGIDIQTTEGAAVRAVFDGNVISVFSVEGSQEIVMIEHGNFTTVYNGLANVTVKAGQHVTTKEVIGRVGKNEEDIPTINFQIWKAIGKKGKIDLNPESWISKAH